LTLEGHVCIVVFLFRKNMLKKLIESIVDWVGAGIVGGMKILYFYIRVYLFGDSLPNYSSVIDKKLYRGGQPSSYGLKELQKKGIGIVVNLRARNGDKKAIARLTEGDMDSIHVPIYPFYPTDLSVIKFLRLFTKELHLPIYVHCFHGADRTGMMCAMYRIIFEGWDKARAIAEMKSNGFHFWQRSILNYIKNSDVESLKKQIFSPI
jgi:tyrosine-protein phosphatase SIW14